MTPTRTIYVSDADSELFDQAASKFPSLSKAVVAGLRLALDEANLNNGLDRITLRLDAPPRVRRFMGRALLSERTPVSPIKDSLTEVYITRREAYVVYRIDSIVNNEKLAQDPFAHASATELSDVQWYEPHGCHMEIFDTFEDLQRDGGLTESQLARLDPEANGEPALMDLDI